MLSTEKYVKKLSEKFREEISARKESPQENTTLSSNVIDVVGANLEIQTNAKLHHTDKFEQTLASPKRLIVRRGNPFFLTALYDGKNGQNVYDPAKHKITLSLRFGKNPSVEKMTKVFLVVQNPDYELTTDEWGAKLHSNSQNEVRIQMNAPVDARVGEWGMAILSGIKSGGTIKDFATYTHPNNIYILFNPWCPDDQVFLEKESALNEYIMNEYGIVSWTSEKNWNFGQFDDVSLSAALLLLEMEELNENARNDPILIARTLSAGMTKHVLEGKWPGLPHNPRGPAAKETYFWKGSVAILQEFINEGWRVQYGQCDVFAGLMCTMLRAVGIPTRCITGYPAAVDLKDYGRSLTSDLVYQIQSDNEMTRMHYELIWFFHAWNEIWCKRPDLPNGYNGWQVVDATYKEFEEGCGPFPLRALYRGEVNLKYDGWFIFSGSNADRVQWTYTVDETAPNGNRLFECKIVDTNAVGQHIFTQSTESTPTAPVKISVKDLYKPSEEKAERSQVIRAVKDGNRKHREAVLKLYDIENKKTPTDVEFNFNHPGEVKLGEDIQGCLTLMSKAQEKRTIHLTLKMLVLTYNGGDRYEVDLNTKDYTMKSAGGTVKVAVNVQSAQYEDKLQENNQVFIEVFAIVKETKQIFSRRFEVPIKKPMLSIQLQKETESVPTNVPLPIKITFANPLNEILTNVCLHLQGSGLKTKGLVEIKCQKNLGGGSRLEAHHTVTPVRTGCRVISAVLTSDQFTTDGDLFVNVEQPKDEDDFDFM